MTAVFRNCNLWVELTVQSIITSKASFQYSRRYVPMKTCRARRAKTGKAEGERKGMLFKPQWSTRSQNIDTL